MPKLFHFKHSKWYMSHGSNLQLLCIFIYHSFTVCIRSFYLQNHEDGKERKWPVFRHHLMSTALISLGLQSCAMK